MINLGERIKDSGKSGPPESPLVSRTGLLLNCPIVSYYREGS